MPNTDKARLLSAALEARNLAVARYSHFRVGAALLTETGEIITGANVESASYGLTCCAERVAVFKAVTSGHRNFTAIAVVAAVPGGPTPCGACRQILAEYAQNALVWVAEPKDTASPREFTVRELLPEAFVDFGREKR